MDARSEDYSEISCLAKLPGTYYIGRMKSITIRLPEPLIAAIDAESRGRGISKSDVVRERLERGALRTSEPSPVPYDIADVVGSVDRGPSDLSARKKEHLRKTGYGRKRPR
jgi:predicted DNA binding CopG/RHH family protein